MGLNNIIIVLSLKRRAKPSKTKDSNPIPILGSFTASSSSSLPDMRLRITSRFVRRDGNGRLYNKIMLYILSDQRSFRVKLTNNHKNGICEFSKNFLPFFLPYLHNR